MEQEMTDSQFFCFSTFFFFFFFVKNCLFIRNIHFDFNLNSDRRTAHRLVFLNSSWTLEKSFWFSFLFWEFLVFNWKKNIVCLWTSHCDIIDVFFPSCRFSINIYAIWILIFWRRGIVRSIFKRRRRREKIWRFLKVGVFCIDGQRSVGVTIFHILDIRTRPSHIVSTHRDIHTHSYSTTKPNHLPINYDRWTIAQYVTSLVSFQSREEQQNTK